MQQKGLGPNDIERGREMKNLKYVTTLPDSEKCVGMVEHNSRVFVATEKSVYELVGDTLMPIKFKIPKGE